MFWLQRCSHGNATMSCRRDKCRRASPPCLLVPDSVCASLPSAPVFQANLAPSPFSVTALPPRARPFKLRPPDPSPPHPPTKSSGAVCFPRDVQASVPSDPVQTLATRRRTCRPSYCWMRCTGLCPTCAHPDPCPPQDTCGPSNCQTTSRRATQAVFMRHDGGVIALVSLLHVSPPTLAGPGTLRYLALLEPP